MNDKTLYIINGPNLDMLGVREPNIYGKTSLADVKSECERTAGELGCLIKFSQYNGEGQIVDELHEAYGSAAAVIINAGAYTHYSYAVADAVKMLNCPVIEVHISNVFARENFRRESVISPYATAVMCGCGTYGYRLAVELAAHLIEK